MRDATSAAEPQPAAHAAVLARFGSLCVILARFSRSFLNSAAAKKKKLRR